MESKSSRPLKEAIINLDNAIKLYDQRAKDDPLPFLTASKAFEVAVEYGWRELKTKVEDEGLDVPSPKAAVREAARLKIIDDPEFWLKAIEARNASVHDYFGIGEEEFISIAREFFKVAKTLL
jgi:uncharacterized protein YutE (UPF0331/DUF86 family)